MFPTYYFEKKRGGKYMKLTILNTFSQIALALPTVLLLTFGAIIATRVAKKEPVSHIIAIGVSAIVISCGNCIGITNSRNAMWDNMITEGYVVYYDGQAINPEVVSSLNLYNIHINNKSRCIYLSPAFWNYNNSNALLAVDKP